MSNFNASWLHTFGRQMVPSNIAFVVLPCDAVGLRRSTMSQSATLRDGGINGGLSEQALDSHDGEYRRVHGYERACGDSCSRKP
jgi:hypothetical protein